MTEPDYCEGCDYSPVAIGLNSECPVHDKGKRDKKIIPLGKECEWYYSTQEKFVAINLEIEKELEERKRAGSDNNDKT